MWSESKKRNRKLQLSGTSTRERMAVLQYRKAAKAVGGKVRFNSCIKMRDFVDCVFDNPFITGGNRHES